MQGSCRRIAQQVLLDSKADGRCTQQACRGFRGSAVAESNATMESLVQIC